MATPTIRPPFAWLGRYTESASLVLVTLLGAFFRFFHLPSLPPGLYDSSAQLGLQSLKLLEHGTLPGLNAADAYAPVWVWLTALSVKLLGHTEMGLRIWPAILGTLAVVTTWLWLRSWFSLRVAWLGSLIVAVTPWAVTISRNDIIPASIPLLVTLTLWTGTIAWRSNKLLNWIGLAATLVLDLMAGPVGWLLALVAIGTGIVQLAKSHKLTSLSRGKITAAAIVAGGLAIFGYQLGTSLDAVRALPHVSGLTTNIGTLGANLVKTLLMFSVAGDENYRHNFASEPLLNVFVGLMLVAGILVSISRLHERRYRLLFVFFIVLLLPAFVTNVGIPNAARAMSVMPVIAAFAAIGISYMLELWYATFPINSAARATGQIAILLLLALSVFQGYAQYFRAWAGSSGVYAAYNEGAVQMAHNLRNDKFNGTRYVVGPADQQIIVEYLDHNQVGYQAIKASDIATLPIATTNREFLITAISRDEAANILKLKFPGGVLRPHYSSFNLTEIYYSYEVSK